MDQLQHALRKSRTGAPPSIKTMACYPGDCPIRPQSPRIPSYTCQPVTRWLPADALPGRQRSDALSFCGVHTAAAKNPAKPLSPIMAALSWNPPITWGSQSVPVAFGVVVAVLYVLERSYMYAPDVFSCLLAFNSGSLSWASLWLSRQVGILFVRLC